MAKCLGIPHSKLLLTTDKNATANLVWTTVLVLVFCTSQLSDLHELWYEMAAAATAWLFQQPHFVEHREDLVQSACAALTVRDVATLLETVFVEPKDEEALALEAALGDWKLCYLDEPPYTAYYWNEKTNLSTWRNPLETAQLEKEKAEKQRQRDELLAKVLPLRVKINRDTLEPPKVPHCGVCSSQNGSKSDSSIPPPRFATVYCTACNGRYFCDECCDNIHSVRDKLVHIETSFRYVQCDGIKGFPLTRKRGPSSNPQVVNS
jgi:hypothetical protein